RDVDVQRRGRAGQATGRRCLGPALRVLVLNDHDGIPDLDLGVRDGPARPGKAHPLGRAEHGRVELQGLPGALDGEAGRDTPIRIRNRAGRCWCCHPVLLHDELRCPSTHMTIGVPPVTTTVRELVTSLARAVLALSGQPSWCLASASFPELPCLSYQAPISAIHASRSGPRGRWPASVIMPTIRSFTSRRR